MDREINIDPIRALEEQVKEHERAIIKLKRARNSLLNVSRLPSEVLGNILAWNVILRGDFDGLERGSHNFLLVCFHWFEVASRTPALWAFWGNNLEDWEKRHLRSSPGAPLDLVLDAVSYTIGSVSESQQAVLKDRAGRDTIRRVHLKSTMSSLLASIISPLLSSGGGLQTNSLESLILDNKDNTPLDASFFARSSLSKLRHLELSGCKVTSWDHSTSQTTLLTTLQLFFDETSPAPTVPQLLSMLASNPHLRKLVLNARAIPDGDGHGHGSSPVPLRHLESLSLEGDTGQVFGLLRCLEHPRKLNMLKLRLLHCTVTDVSQTIVPHLRDYTKSCGTSSSALGLSHSSHRCITLAVGTSRPSTSLWPRVFWFVLITMRFNQALPEDALTELALNLTSYAPRQEISYFQTQGNLGAMMDLRAQMPNLKVLDLRHVPLSAMFLKPERGGSRVCEIFPPSLQYLLLERPHLDARGWSPLITFLSHRSSSGNQLDSLLIHGSSHVCPRVAEAIRDVVRKLEVGKGCLQSRCPCG